MSSGAMISVRGVEEHPDGMRVTMLDFERAGHSVAPFKASIFTIEPDSMSPADEHHVRECWVVIAGRGELTVAGETSLLEAGSITYFESRQPHQVRNVGDEVLTIFSAWWPPHDE